MNKLHKVLLIASGLMLTIASTSMAQFVSIKKQYLSAGTTTGGTKTIDFTLSIRDTGNVSVQRSSITWAAYDPATLGANTWRMASQLIALDSTITDLTGGIQIATDNREVGANPKFMDPSPTISSNTDSNPAGLVLATGTASNFTLPMAWSIKDSTKAIENAIVIASMSIGASDPNSGPSTAVYNNRFQWLFMTDKTSPAIDYNGSGVLGDRNANGDDTTQFVDGQEGARLLDDRGIHYAQANADGTPAFGGGTGRKLSYVYLETNFASALPATPYATNRLLIEAFSE